MKFLSVLNVPGSRGVNVRVPVPDDHPDFPNVGRFFSFADHGGMEGAIDAARTWRDQTGETVWGEDYFIRLLPDTFSKPHYRLSTANTSGVCGVSLIQNHGNWQWQARWQVNRGEGGKRYTNRRQFSVAKYGYDEAKRLAVEAREAGTLEELLRVKKTD